jgi:hypothetical protein
MTQSPQWLTTCCQDCVRTNCSADFGLVPAALILIITNANWLLILTPQRREDRRFTGQGHEGMGITKADYVAFMRFLDVSLDTFEMSEPERSEVVGSVTSLEPEIVEA